MNWLKRGVIFAADNNHEWMVSHASIPTVDRVGDERLRVYFGTRDKQGRSHPSYIEVEAGDPQKILYVHDKPILPLGKLGTFDDSGIMPSWIVDVGQSKYLYYIAWNTQVTVSYRLSIGLAISEDGGKTFRKYSEGPICDRDVNEPYFNTAPCVLVDGDKWRMWYASCTGWEVINGWPEPYYHVKYAESSDGISWRKTNIVCIDYENSNSAIGRPCVVKEAGVYRMFYSYRGVKDYRTDPRQSYRLGYAESADGIVWRRQDDRVGIERSATGWDSGMMEYCYLFKHQDQKYLFYNGDGFGKTGFGYAALSESHQ